MSQIHKSDRQGRGNGFGGAVHGSPESSNSKNVVNLPLPSRKSNSPHNPNISESTRSDNPHSSIHLRPATSTNRSSSSEAINLTTQSNNVSHGGNNSNRGRDNYQYYLRPDNSKQNSPNSREQFRGNYRGNNRGYFSNENTNFQNDHLYVKKRSFKEHIVSEEKLAMLTIRASNSENWRNGSSRGFSRGGRGRGRGYAAGNSSSPSSTFSGPFDDPQKPPKSWAVFCFDDYYNLSVKEDKLEMFVEMMANQAIEFGMIFEQPKKVSVTIIQDIEDVVLFFEDLFRDRQLRNLELLFVGIPNSFKKMTTDNVYQYVKHYCDSEYGIISQCFKADYVEEIPENYFCHFLLKVNAKLGGLNKVFEPDFLKSLPLEMGETMIVGIVNHLVEFGQIKCSITVAEGSYDNVFSKYSSSVRVQAREPYNMVIYVESMLRELLHEYRSKNGGKNPKNLIVYRDGVSRAQFEEFILSEVEPIENLLVKLQNEENQIKFTVIVVQKRRVPAPPKAGRKVYFPIQTLHDPDVNEGQRDLFDLDQFYMPTDVTLSTKYITVRDDVQLSSEQLAKLTYYCCQNYSRSMAKIDIPTCIRYADLCGGRSKIHAQFELGELNKKDKSANEETIIRRLNSHVQMDRKMKTLLYYC